MMRWVIILLAVLTLAVIRCGERLTEEQLRARSLDYENKEQWEEAVKTYEKLVKTYPRSRKADEDLYNMGVIYANNLKDYQRAVEAYNRLIEEYPQSSHVIKANFMIGYLYANDIKDLNRAREAYQYFLEKYPDHELAISVRWELEHLGQDISEIELQLNNSSESN